MLALAQGVQDGLQGRGHGVVQLPVARPRHVQIVQPAQLALGRAQVAGQPAGGRAQHREQQVGQQAVAPDGDAQVVQLVGVSRAGQLAAGARGVVGLVEPAQAFLAEGALAAGQPGQLDAQQVAELPHGFVGGRRGHQAAYRSAGAVALPALAAHEALPARLVSHGLRDPVLVQDDEAHVEIPGRADLVGQLAQALFHLGRPGLAQGPGKGIEQAAQAAQGDAQVVQRFLTVLGGGAPQRLRQVALVDQQQAAQGLPGVIGGPDQHVIRARPVQQGEPHRHDLGPEVRLEAGPLRIARAGGGGEVHAQLVAVQSQAGDAGVLQVAVVKPVSHPQQHPELAHRGVAHQGGRDGQQAVAARPAAVQQHHRRHPP